MIKKDVEQVDMRIVSFRKVFIELILRPHNF